MRRSSSAPEFPDLNESRWARVLAECKAGAAPESAPGAITKICILTANRLPAFQRAATSYIENAKRFGRQVELIVADDSKTAEVRSQYREAVAQIAKVHDIKCFYAGHEEKIDYITRLAKESGVERDIIEFGLLDPFGIKYSPGAGRNALFLHNAGEVFFCADDDTVCKIGIGRTEQDALRVTGRLDPTNIWPFQDFTCLESSARFVDADFLGLHEKCLGKDFGSVFSGVSEIDVTPMAPELIERIRLNLPRVLVSWTGFAGDCGHRSPLFLYDLGGAAYREFTKSADSYAKILSNRQIVRAPDRLTVNLGGFCQSTALAFDNRGLLPPFLPVLRAQDSVFAQLLYRGIANSAIAYLPETVLHIPFTSRTYTSEDHKLAATRRSVSPLFSALLGSAMRNQRFNTSSRLHGIAVSVRSLLASRDFPHFVQYHFQQESRFLIEKYQSLIELNPEAPKYWVEDVETLMESCRQVLQAGRFIAPEGLLKSGDADDSIELLQQILIKYMDLIVAWPALISAAKKLKRDGGELALLQKC